MNGSTKLYIEIIKTAATNPTKKNLTADFRLILSEMYPPINPPVNIAITTGKAKNTPIVSWRTFKSVRKGPASPPATSNAAAEVSAKRIANHVFLLLKLFFVSFVVEF